MSKTFTTTVSAVIFTAVCLLVLSIEYTAGLVGTSHYYLGHFFFGLAFPYLGYGVFSLGRDLPEKPANWVYARPALHRALTRFLAVATHFYFWLGVTTFWHLGNELWEDQKTRAVFSVDLDHLTAGIIGLVLSAAIYEAIRKQWPQF
ncbi:hypothetical protein [Marinobacter sp.]|uniref:hypothetical protein n=1 Tax=Marinobacter sp. TaxID=50741 RepID=UPI003561A074